MAVTKRNYLPGESQALSQEQAGIVSSGSNQYFSFEGYFKFEVADPIIYATVSKTLVAPADYDLVADVVYTDLESTFSGKTLIAQIKFTNPAYDGEPFFVSGLNFGTMVDNEEMKRYADDHDVQSDYTETDTQDLSYIKNKPTIIDPVQSDYAEDDTESLAFIKNKPTKYVLGVYDQAGMDIALQDDKTTTIIIENPLSDSNPTPLEIDTVLFGNKDLNIIGVGTEVVLKNIVAPDGLQKSVNILCDVKFTEDVTIGQNIDLKCRRLDNNGNHSITYISGSSFTYEEMLLGSPPNGSVFDMWYSTGGFYVDEYSNEDVTPRNNSFNFLDVDVQADFTYYLPDTSPDKQFYSYLGRLGNNTAGRVRIQTESGTQLVGGQLTQIITGDREGITVISRGSEYEIVQDSRGASVLKLPGVLENKDYILKVDENNISIEPGIGRFRKGNKNVVQFSWDSIPSQAVTIADNTLQWVMFKLNVAEDDIDLLFLSTAPDTLLEYEGYTLIGRIWREDGVLRTGDRHMGLSVDPYASRTAAWVNKSSNVSVLGSFSPLDSNLFSFSAGELYRWPVVGIITNHHIWSYAGDPSVDYMWEHMRNQTAFNIIADNAAGDETDIRSVADYYDLNGVHTSIPTNDFGAHLIGVYAGSGVKVFIRSQYTYDTMLGAQTGIYTDSLDFSAWAADFDQISFISWVIAKEGTTDFSNTADVKFVQYQSGGGGGGGGSVSLSYDHVSQFGRKGSTGMPVETDVDLPVTWFEESPAGTWGFDGQAPSKNATLGALLAGTIVGFSITFETLTADVTIGFKINGVKDATTWTIPASAGRLLQFPVSLSYDAGDEVIPFVRHTVSWEGTGIRLMAYSRGLVT